ncbi:hypothetical protein B0H16DRAFT_1768206 [Mycena metata]|uniref:Uncharacterized protein n=1 Tax=Mycena metata TaxID=1033252 RepID=A0AAD7I2R6_9AGAR|nr:hypothetical protein B0H16DRAFT_1768206 [Mycena metata]
MLVANPSGLKLLVYLSECLAFGDATEAEMADDDFTVGARGLECSRDLLRRRLLGSLVPRISGLNPRTGWSQVLGITLLCTMFWHLRVNPGGTLVLSGVRGAPWRQNLTANVRRKKLDPGEMRTERGKSHHSPAAGGGAPARSDQGAGSDPVFCERRPGRERQDEHGKPQHSHSLPKFLLWQLLNDPGIFRILFWASFDKTGGTVHQTLKRLRDEAAASSHAAGRYSSPFITHRETALRTGHLAALDPPAVHQGKKGKLKAEGTAECKFPGSPIGPNRLNLG